MYIPNAMREAIKKAFYDKTINIMQNEIETDTEGYTRHNGFGIKSTFNGNVSFSNCKIIREEYGLDYDINISITCDLDTNIAINDIIKYENIIYKVTDVLISDSHALVVAVIWHQ